MHRIDCPHCGVRDEAEFTYRGDASVTRPAPNAGDAAFYDYVYDRANPKGWHVEWWHHAGGCRQWIKLVRHTVTHEIRATAKATETPGAIGVLSETSEYRFSTSPFPPVFAPRAERDGGGKTE